MSSVDRCGQDMVAGQKVRHQESLTWKKFVEVFSNRFFHIMAKPEMWKKYLELQQRDQTVNIYATELVRLNRFASTLVVKEEE